MRSLSWKTVSVIIDSSNFFSFCRHGGRLIDGVDIRCRASASVHAPFDGHMYFWRPYGGRVGYGCADHGVRIDGSGQWQGLRSSFFFQIYLAGYYALIASVNPEFYGGKVKQGQVIGKAIAASCVEDITGDHQEFVQLRLYRQGVVVDPTFHLRDCSFRCVVDNPMVPFL